LRDSPPVTERRRSARKDKQDVTTHDTEIGQALRSAVARQVGPERYEQWFGAGQGLSLEDGTVVVAVPSRFHQDWLRTKFREQIETGCREVLGVALPVEFRIADRPTGSPAHGNPPDAAPPVQKDSGGRAAEGHGGPAGRRRFARLGSFVVGDSNRVAFASAQIAVDRAGEMNPLYLHGPSGVGKTHLAEGIWSAARRGRSAGCPLYLTAEQFTTYFQEALHGSGLPNFRRKHRAVDLLLVDDVQFFRGKPRTIGELVHTIDTLLRAGKQVVLTGDAPPADLTALGPELVARLQGGMVARLDLPEYETRVELVRRLADQAGVAMPEEVQRFIAARLAASARELRGAVNLLAAAGHALSRPISLALAQEQLADLIRHNTPIVRLADIGRAVCRAFGLAPNHLRSGQRDRALAQPRMLAMWLARKHTRAALTDISAYFGCRSHSTVVSAHKKVDGWRRDRACLDLDDRQWTIDDAIRRVEDQLRTG
jgi:chromosomal replication initiator protein